MTRLNPVTGLRPHSPDSPGGGPGRIRSPRAGLYPCPVARTEPWSVAVRGSCSGACPLSDELASRGAYKAALEYRAATDDTPPTDEDRVFSAPGAEPCADPSGRTR